MADTEHFGIPKPDPTAQVDEEFYRLIQAWDLVDGKLYEFFQSLSGKALANHSHSIDAIQGLAQALAEKMDVDQSYSLDDLMDVNGASGAATGYVLVKTPQGWSPSSPAAAIGNHEHSIDDVQGLKSALDKAVDPWGGMPIGVPIPIFLHLPGVVLPAKDKEYRYVLLTAGLTGTGQYNQGILRNETVSGQAPDLTATAIVNLTGSPFNGSTIHLINSMKTFLRPGTANIIEAAQNLSHTHTATAASDSHSHTGTTSSDSHSHSGTTASAGAHTHNFPASTGTVENDDFVNVSGTNQTDTVTTSSAGAHTHTFSTSSDSHSHSFTTSADAHTHTITVAANGGNENRPRNLNVQYVMRIQ